MTFFYSPCYFFDRLFGVSSLIQTSCSSTWKIITNPKLEWHYHVNPILLLVLYYTLATLIRLWLHEPNVQVKQFYFDLFSNYLLEEDIGTILVCFHGMCT